jgi:hypothetical protein
MTLHGIQVSSVTLMPIDPPELLDTQLISYAFKGRRDISVTGRSISAITANEFLLVQSAKYAQANYYVPLLSRLNIPGSVQGDELSDWQLDVVHPFDKRATDRVTLEFGNEFPTVVEYGNLAIAVLINKRTPSPFYAATEFLEKTRRRTICQRFDFLLQNEMNCLPLSRNAAFIGIDLLQEFRVRHNLKANFRNSLNDILALATAIDVSATLLTADILLGEFAAKHLAVDHRTQGDVIAVDFGQGLHSSSRKSTESKGYINTGWRVSFSNYR